MLLAEVQSDMSKSIQVFIYECIVLACPPVLLGPVLGFAATLRWLFYSRAKSTELSKCNNILRKKKNKKAYIMATGPSMQGMDLLGIEDADFYSVSNFILHDDVKDLNLVAHFFANYHQPLILDEYLNWLALADETLGPETALCLSYDVKEFVDRRQLFDDREVYYFAFEKEFSLLGLSVSKPFPSPHTSPIFLLALTIAMGYEEIYLCGCDHTVLRDYGGVVKNFYDADREPRQHATSGSRWDTGIKYHIENLRETIRQYDQLNRLAKERSVRIFNLSTDSWLEMFPNG